MRTVTESTLVKRINRRLRHRNEAVRKTRNEICRIEWGDFFYITTDTNFIIETHIDIEELGRELHVLAEYEALEAA